MKTASRKLPSIVKSRYWRREDAEVVIEAWRESGEGLSVFARRWSLKTKRLARWAAQLEKENAGVGFHPVRLVEWERPVEEERCVVAEERWLAEVECGRWTVRVPVRFDAEEMARLLDVVGEVEPC